MAGRGKALRWHAFGLLAVEGVVYAFAMRAAASAVVGELFLGPPTLGVVGETGAFSGLVLSCGAGFYEEVMFRVALFGGGLTAIKILFPLSRWHKPLVFVGWALITSLVFSLWHYVGPLGDPLEPKSFVFRWVCGVVFTVIFAFRGFAPAVWTHALYDIWVLVF
jgi:membrane protease YdiL (CAAX protease family)